MGGGLRACGMRAGGCMRCRQSLAGLPRRMLLLFKWPASPRSARWRQRKLWRRRAAACCRAVAQVPLMKNKQTVQHAHAPAHSRVRHTQTARPRSPRPHSALALTAATRAGASAQTRPRRRWCQVRGFSSVCCTVCTRVGVRACIMSAGCAKQNMQQAHWLIAAGGCCCAAGFEFADTKAASKNAKKRANKKKKGVCTCVCICARVHARACNPPHRLTPAHAPLL